MTGQVRVFLAEIWLSRVVHESSLVADGFGLSLPGMKRSTVLKALGLSFTLALAPAAVPTAHASGTPAFYKISAGSAANASTLSFNHDVGSGQNRLLVVAVVIRDALQHPSSVSYKNVGMTRVSENECKITSVTPEIVSCRQSVWILANPPAGINQVRVNLVGPSPRTMAKATSYTGVNQSIPIGPVAAGGGVGPGEGATSVFPITRPGDLVYSTAAATADTTVNLSPGAGQTQRGVMTGTPPLTIGVGDRPAASGTFTTEMRWNYSSSSDNVVDALTAFAIQPAQLACNVAGTPCSVTQPTECCSLNCQCLDMNPTCTCG